MARPLRRKKPALKRRTGVRKRPRKTARRAADKDVARLAAILEALPESFAVFDADDRFVFCNRKYRDLNGPVADLLTPGTPFETQLRSLVGQVLIADAVGREEAWIQDRLDRHRNPHGPFESARANGTWVRLNEARLPDGGTVIIASDITDRRRAEEALQQSEAQLRAFLQYSPSGLYIKDLEGRYVVFGTEAAHRLGMEPEDAIGKTSHDIFTKEAADGFVEHDRAAVEQGKAVSREHTFSIKGSAERSRLIVKFPLRNAAGAITGIGSLATDITDRKRAEEALRQTEAQFRAFVRHSPSDVHIKDLDGRYIVFSGPAAHRLEIAPEDAIGKTVHDIFPKEVADGFAAHDRDALEKGEAVEREHTSVVNGEKRTRLLVKFPIRDAHGNITALGSISSDITERKRSEETARASEQVLRAVIDTIPAMVNAKDEQSRYVTMNRYQAHLYGVSPEGAVGRSASELMGEAYGKYTESVDRKVFETGEATAFYEEDWSDRHGERHIFLTRKVPLRDDRGKVRNVVTVSLDITERKRDEEALLKAKDEAESANRTKTEFLANMSHELRTPLNAIIGFSEAIRDGTLGKLPDGRQREYLDAINQSGIHLLHVINEVLDASKVDAGTLVLAESVIDVRAALEKAAKMIARHAATNQVALTTSAAPGVPSLKADPFRIQQILVNLLSNAVKFTPASGRVSAIGRLGRDGGIEFEIADTGVGISEDDIPRVVQPFYQVANILTRNHEGTGLGLAIVKSLTELHGGTLTIASAPKKGTTVTVRMPASRTVNG
ncbi:MAG: PAS domain S-box protein [Rhodospirillales bacterium]|nr:PAS domain S-box protein [Rhodospirillales bacterium]